jgi:hypothetical protein
LKQKDVWESKEFVTQKVFMIRALGCCIFLKKDLTNSVKSGESTMGGAMTISPSTGSEILARGVRTRIFNIPLILVSGAPISL